MKIVVVGAGPSGLYFALLMKTRFPDADIRVYEQNPRGATYGFGIVLADRGLNRFRDAHRDSYESIMAASFVSRNRIISHPQETIFIEGGGYGGAIARLRLLEILDASCTQCGVIIEYDARIDNLDAYCDADLVVGADGVNSCVRQFYEQQFGTTTYNLTNRIAWYGTTRQFPYPTLTFARTQEGHFVGVAYSYNERMSTFVAECDAGTWTRSGLDHMSEAEGKALAERVFAEQLGGAPLIGNKSAWRVLPVVRNREWSVGHCVLIGDALHSAHPSIGSGTRIAMEDSIALAHALELNPGNIAQALTVFRRVREPQKLKMVEASEKSFNWYETFPEKVDQLGPIEFVFDYLMRTGRVSEERLHAEYPEFTARYGLRMRSPSSEPSIVTAS